MRNVNSVLINPPSVRPTWDGNFLGHEFEVVIQVTNPSECQLRWYEKTDIPYLDERAQMIFGRREVIRRGMRAGIWNNMYELMPDSDVFKPWRNVQAQARPGCLTVIRIKDIPATELPKTGTKKRYLEFRIIVEGIDGTERAAIARQDLEGVDGRPTRSSFTVWQNNVSTNPGRFVGSTAPTYLG